jgi:predicted glycogen debranching enzyme
MANPGSVDLNQLLGREWLAVNHIGGFASSTLAGLNTRKYHGLLVASMAPPVRRMVLLSRVEETLTIDGRPQALACSEYPGTIHPDGHTRLRAFRADPYPRWAYQGDGFTLEKQLRLVRGKNTVVMSYTLLAGSSPAKLELRPLFALRPMHELTYQWNGRLDAEDRSPQHHRIPPTMRTPEVFFAHTGGFEAAGCWYMSTIYRRECERGYAGLEDLWMPGIVRQILAPGQTLHFVCSTDPIDLEKALDERDAPDAPATGDAALDALQRAASQYLIHSPRATLNLVTQYPWSAPSARDALIAFVGLLLTSARFDDARRLLDTMCQHLRDGLMPSEFPEDGSPPRFLGADVSLWFINAVHGYLRYSGDQQTVRDRYFQTVLRIIRCYQSGTALGISVDPDGLLASHEPGQPTSWMDAKVGDWVITPRQGRTVELNALWYNAVRIAAGLCQQWDHGAWATDLSRLAESVRIAFNKRFWNELAGCCFDVINDRGADPSVRPNQVLAISLPYAVLTPQRHALVLEKLRTQLLTPLGLRSLATDDPSYQGHYRGDVVARDRAYHQGSAYPWLLGPLASAMVRVFGRDTQSRQQARAVLDGCLQHLLDQGQGQLCELFDGDAPHAAGGAMASARSVGAILQAYVEDVLDRGPLIAEASARTTPITAPAAPASGA